MLVHLASPFVLMLKQYDVIAKEFDNPREPQEKEVTLISRDGSPLPIAIVVEKYLVNCDGVRQEDQNEHGDAEESDRIGVN